MQRSPVHGTEGGGNQSTVLGALGLSHTDTCVCVLSSMTFALLPHGLQEPHELHESAML